MIVMSIAASRKSFRHRSECVASLKTARGDLLSFLFPMLLNGFRLLLVKQRNFVSGAALSFEYFIELGMDRLGVAVLRPLDNERHEPCRDGRRRVPIERRWVADEPNRDVQHHYTERHRVSSEHAEAR